MGRRGAVQCERRRCPFSASSVFAQDPPYRLYQCSFRSPTNPQEGALSPGSEGAV